MSRNPHATVGGRSASEVRLARERPRAASHSSASTCPRLRRAHLRERSATSEVRAVDGRVGASCLDARRKSPAGPKQPALCGRPNPCALGSRLLPIPPAGWPSSAASDLAGPSPARETAFQIASILSCHLAQRRDLVSTMPLKIEKHKEYAAN